jgi:hypothetical protein
MNIQVTSVPKSAKAVECSGRRVRDNPGGHQAVRGDQIHTRVQRTICKQIAAYAKALVKRHGGRIRCESGPGGRNDVQFCDTPKRIA